MALSEGEVKLLASTVIDIILESSSSDSQSEDDSENENYCNVI